MQKAIISMRQFICMIVLFLFGSSAVQGGSWGVGQDAWIAVLIALGFGSMIVLVYARLICLFPGRSFYDIAQSVFGTIIGKVIIALMTWYAIHLGAILIRLLSEFINIVALQETPQLPMMIMILFVTGYMAFSGIETVGKLASIALPLHLLIDLYAMALSVTDIRFSNVLPIMEHSINALLMASLKIFTTTFAGTVIFLFFADAVKKKNNPYKIYIYSIFISALLLVAIFLLSVMVLGVPMVEKSYFPFYTAVRTINMGEFLSRIEMMVFYNFLLGGIVKISVCLLAAERGLQKVFNIKNKGKNLAIVSLLILVVGMFEFDSIIELINFTDIYQYYVLPFQVVIPILLWIGAEIKSGKKRSH